MTSAGVAIAPSGANNHLIVDTAAQVLTQSSTRAWRQRIVAIPRIGRHGVRFREWRFAGSNRLFGRLPVLLNVLRGDMAIVGPRPVSVDDHLASDLSHPRFSVRPGLVGLWWIRQQAKIDYDGENDTDREYARTRSVRGDFFLLLRAIVLLKRGRQGKRSANRVPILGLPVYNVSMNEALDRIIGGLRQQSPMRVSFLNADCVNVAVRHPAYREVLHRAHLLLPDGIGLRMGARVLGYELRQNVNGTDLFPRLCARLASKKKRVFLLGARPGVADGVAKWIDRHHPGIVTVGTQHGYFDATQNDEVVERIRAAKPDLLLAAFGAPRQDIWLDKHLAETGARVGLAVGGLFDFYSGRVQRAPLWVREIGCEWMYRLAKEPRRLWRRYLYGNGLFLAHIWRERARRSTRTARAMERSLP